MNLNPDLHRQYTFDRQQRLLDEAAASRLAGSVPARRRIALFLRRAADRLDAATAASSHVGGALTERG